MLAIIIPFYKITFFEATLQSLASQTNKRFKVYIGDDASPEDCSSLLQHFKGQFDFVFHRFEMNLGSINLTQQWERCIALSNNEEWLMILGDDDVLSENVVASFYEHVKEINQQSSQVIRFASRYIDGNQLPLKGYSDYFHPQLEKTENAFYRNFSGNSRSSLSEHIFSRYSLLHFGFYDYPLAWHTDDRAWLEFANNKPIFTINKAFVEVRVTEQSITGKKDNETLKTIAKINFFDFLVNNKKLQFTREQKVNVLLQFGVLVQNKKPIAYKKLFSIFITFLKLGSLYNAFLFFRRVVKAQFK